MKLAAQTQNQPSYYKSAVWSPDGSCVLTNSADAHLRLYAIPDDLGEADGEESGCAPSPLEAGLTIPCGTSVYETIWYPFMNCADANSCCFFVSSRDSPVHLRDAYTGASRASYVMIDHRERLCAPYAFALDATCAKLYACLEGSIAVFDTARPGHDYRLIKTTPTRRAREGQKGILSCIDFAPRAEPLFAVGSFMREVCLYDLRSDRQLLRIGRPHVAQGVTQVKFSADGLLLFVAARKSNALVGWDIRNTVRPVVELERPGMTNQRIAFQATQDGALFTGDTGGNVRRYSTRAYSAAVAAELDGNEDKPAGDTIANKAGEASEFIFRAHSEAVVAASQSPARPDLVLTASGSRKPVPLPSGAADDVDNDSEPDSVEHDYSLKIWRQYTV